MNKVLVFGAARSGLAVTKLLIQKGFEVVITDQGIIDNKHELENQGVVVYDQGHPELLKNEKWHFIVKNPGISYRQPMIAYFASQKIDIFNETEIALKYSKFKVAAITGTNGKTTTTTLLHAMLNKQYDQAYVAGNIGEPLSALVASGITEGFIALEISAFQLLDTPSLKPFCSTIINLTPDHLDYFKNENSYYQAKQLVYKNQDKSDYFFLNIDDPMVLDYNKINNATIITVSLTKTSDIYLLNEAVYFREHRLFNQSDLKIIGYHNLLNAMIASGIAFLMGVSIENIEDAVSKFNGVEHRIEYVATHREIKFYNDSKATNVDSLITCLKAFKNQSIILIAGGYDKKVSFNDLIPYFNDIKALIVFGETKNQFLKIKEDGFGVDDLDEAMKKALSIATSGDIVVLSPACASYDQYTNYEQRGNHFKNIISNIK